MEAKLNISRRIIHVITRGITWLLFLPGYRYATAQSTTVPPERAIDSYSFDPAMAIVIIVLLSTFFFVAVFSIYIRHCSDTNAAAVEFLPSRPTIGPVFIARKRGMDPKVIEKFPIFKYSAVKDLKIGKGALECAICLSEFEEDETLRLLPKCDHVFHHGCIDAWLASHVTCPVCRAKLKLASAEIDDLPELNNELNRSNSASQSHLDEERGEVVININEEETTNGERRQPDDSNSSTSMTHPPPVTGILENLARSHSTGHSIVQGGENVERYTLRLTEEARKQLIDCGKVRRTMSLNSILAAEGSTRKCCDGEGSNRGKSYRTDRWVFSMIPPFVSRVGSASTAKAEQSEGSSLCGPQV